jgi:hypothetical protein
MGKSNKITVVFKINFMYKDGLTEYKYWKDNDRESNSSMISEF